MGRHIYFRTPTWEDRRDIFDLYLDKVAHDPRRSTRRASRDELARITNGYSPAMIDQVCSMALTYAHSDGRQAFEWEDLLEAMTTVESGVAVGQPYAKHEERSIAVHEAGHAVCSHLYAENASPRGSRSASAATRGGHHQAMRLEDRFVDWRSEQIAGLIWTLGAMAAEYVFYDQTTTGVGGDVALDDGARGQDGRPRGHGPDAARPRRPHRRQGAPRGGRGAHHGALREARHADHAPLGRQHDGRRRRLAACSPTAASGAWPRR